MTFLIMHSNAHDTVLVTLGEVRLSERFSLRKISEDVSNSTKAVLKKEN